MTQSPVLLNTVTTRSLRLLFVAVRFYPFMGGLETHVYEVARRLVEAGVAVTVLTADPSSALPVEEDVEGVHIRRVRTWPASRDFGIAPVISRIIAEGDWDVVHIQGYHTLFAPEAMLAARRAGVPFVVSFHSGGHSSALRKAVRGLQYAILRPLLAHAARLVAVSDFEAAFFQEKLHLDAGHFAVIPNGAKLPEVANGIGPDPARTLILSVGRLEEYKGHHRLIAALPYVLAQNPSVYVRIVGSGPYEAELRKLAEKLHVSERVEIGPIPPVDRHAMASLLAQASLVTLFSEYEAHPISVMEALAVRRPVLVADTSGLHELSERGYVRSIALDSSAIDTAAAILAQLRHPLVPPAIALPTWEDCVAQLLALYHGIVPRATPTARTQAHDARLAGKTL